MYRCLYVCMHGHVCVCVCVCVCQNLAQDHISVTQTTVANMLLSYAGALSYSWVADSSMSSGNAAPMHHELQNCDPTEHLDMRRCGQRFAIPLGIKKETINIHRHILSE